MDIDEIDAINSTPRDKIIDWFCTHWSTQELYDLILNSEIFNESIIKLVKHFIDFTSDDKSTSYQKKLANILYDIVGSRFLRNENFLLELLKVVTKNDQNGQFTNFILNTASYFSTNKEISELKHIVKIDKKRRWMIKLAEILELPPSCGLNSLPESQPKTEIIFPHRYMNPLYDYQFSLALKIKSMLTGNSPYKRGIISLPTGAGKTRLVVESIIDWINEGQHGRSDKPFVIWIADKEELCSQAFDTFKLVFQDRGKNNTIIALHRFWGKNNMMPSPDENGIIIASISMLDSFAKRFGEVLDEFSELISCVIIDEAHHSIAESYTRVLERFGFNFKMKHPSTKNIILLGLTATPFRQNIDSSETHRLKNRYENNILIPDVSYHDLKTYNQKPHALIDCQNFAIYGEKVRINGDRSYDKDGTISEFNWKIFDQNNQLVKEYFNSQNIIHEFDSIERFKIQLFIVDNENDHNDAISFIDVVEDQSIDNLSDADKMQHVQENLTKRSILCPIEHDEINMPKSNIILTRSEQIFLDTFKDLGTATIKRLGNLLDRNIKLIEKIYEITRNTPHTRKSILLFACSVDHAKNISVILNACLNIKSHYVVGEMDRQDRLNAIKQFRSGELEVLCNYGVLTTGYDSPNIDCVIIARPTMSQLLYTQMIGRGLRGKKSGGTENCLVIDIRDDIQQYNNVEKLNLLWAKSVGLWNDDDPSMESPAKTISENIHDDPLDKLSHTCPRCGFILQLHNEILCLNRH